MAGYDIKKLRNVALVGHGNSGKTSLSEAMLFDAGITSRLGKVDDGNTVSDFDPEEQRRRISVNTSIIPLDWDGYHLTILDTPGYTDFVGEVRSAVRVVEGAVVLLDAVAGVEVGTELVWQHANDYKLPRLTFVNKMDRENANFQQAVDSLAQILGVRPAILQLPIGSQAAFKGVVDLISRTAYVGPKAEKSAVPADMTAQVETARTQLVDVAAEGDDELITKYLDGNELTDEEIYRGLRLGTASSKIVPVLCGSSLANIGAQSLMRALIDLLPSPTEVAEIHAKTPAGAEEVLQHSEAGPLAALAFKTTADPFVGRLTYLRVYSGVLTSDSRAFNSRAETEERIGQLFMIRGKEQIPLKQLQAGEIGGVPKLSNTITSDTLCDKGHPLVLEPVTYPKPVFSAAIAPKTKADLDKMGTALTRLVEEDPTLQVSRNLETNETILAGMGESHVDIAARKLQQKFGVEIAVDVPKVPYRETVTREASAQGRHKKQTGGHGQFGDVWLRLEPLPRSTGFEFADKVFGGSVPRQYIPAVEKGIRETITKGILAGYPVVDIRVALYDGSYHAVDSSEMAFKIAANLGFRKAMEEAGPVLLEPVMSVTITIPEQYMGDVLGDLNTRRARVLGMDQAHGRSIVTALAPLAEMLRYATNLKSITQGRGVYKMELSHYEEVPAHVTQQIINAAKAAEEEKK
jgi:elongation factor G